MKKIDICYIVSHGFAARMIIQTNLLGRIRDCGLSVAVITPDINDSVLRSYCDQRKIKLFHYQPSVNSGWNNNYIRKRRYLFENIRENTALYEKHIYEIRFSQIRNPIRRLKPLYWMLLHRLILIFPSLKGKYENKELKILKSKEAEQLLFDIQPGKVVATYPVNLAESQILFSSKRNNIETWIHLLSWDNITSKGKFPVLADKYIVWGKVMKGELQKHYNINNKEIFQSGVPHFDLHHNVKNNLETFDITKYGLRRNVPIIFFGMSSPRFAPFEIDIVESLAKTIEGNELGEEFQLIIRPHPQNVKGNMADLSWLPRLKRLNNYIKVYVDFPDLNESNLSWSMQSSDMKRMSFLIANSSVVINSGSTISIDALYHEKPVIISSFDGVQKLNYWKSARRLIDYTHLKKLISSKGIEIATSQEELNKLILKYFKNPQYNITKRNLTLKNQLDDISGGATSKVVEILTKN